MARFENPFEGMSEGRLRVIVAALMAAIVAAAFAVGPVAVRLMALVCSALMVYEYDRMFFGRVSAKLAFDVVFVAGTLGFYAFKPGSFPAYWSVVSLVVAASASALWGVAGNRPRWVLESLAAPYVGFGALSFLYIYGTAPGSALAYVFVITIATDTGAYFVGCSLKGPKLAPSISPNKTWSGALGGLLSAFVFGTAFQIWALMSGGGDMASLHIWAVLSLLLSVLAEAGDLFESKLKRLSGVKDSSGFVPGHGGFLDRFDSFLFAAPAVALLVAFTRIGYTAL